MTKVHKLNLYVELRDKHQREFNELPIFFAFSKEQMEENMKKHNIKKTEPISSLGVVGGFARSSDIKQIVEKMNQHEQEFKAAINDPEKGDQFIYEMFHYELNNHEYGYTRDVEDTLMALGYEAKDILDNPRLSKGLSDAIKSIEDYENSKE